MNLLCTRLDRAAFASQNTRIGAGIAQLVERNLAKVEVASSNLVSRSNYYVLIYIDVRLVRTVRE